MISLLAPGLLPRLAAAGAIVLLIGAIGVIVERQAEVSSRGRQITHLEAGLTECQTARGALIEANGQLSAAATRQRRALDEVAASAASRQAASAAALRAARRESDDQRAAAQWLAAKLQRPDSAVTPGECEAAAAVRVVREALR